MREEDFTGHLEELRKRISNPENPKRLSATQRASVENQWFTQESIDYAISALVKMLEANNVKKWLSSYDWSSSTPKNIGVVMAGNIPLVGFHDVLSVLASGNKISAKLSSQDSALIRWIFEELQDINSIYEFLIEEVENIKNVDAIIATGSDNTSRYFEYYFKDIPHIIRKNRTSVAILDGTESDKELGLLADDIFLYYGLGCRNVSKLFVPKDYSLEGLHNAFQKYKQSLDFHKYSNNYEYNKAIYLMKQSDIRDLDVILLEKTDQLVSPIAVNYMEEYDSLESLKENLEQRKEKIQCIVGKKENHANIRFGETQTPALWDYADNVDTLKFLINLND